MRVPPARTLVLGGIGLIVLVAVGWWLLRPAAPPVEATLPMAGTEASAATGSDGATAEPGGSQAPGATTTAPDLVVQAAGAVAEPGVYRLAPGARIDDLVRAAGGLADGADADRVNLAAPLADGERVWVPAQGEEAPPAIVAGGGGGGGGTGAAAPGGPAGGATTDPSQPVDLNTATAAQLDALPGIGPATATAILAHRDQIGRFGSVDELLDVRGIGEAKLEQLRPLVRV